MNNSYNELICSAKKGKWLKREDIARLLECSTVENQVELLSAAYEVKIQEVGKLVQLRGLIELSNCCRCDCFYCGIRRSNLKNHRFTLSVKEIVEAAVRARDFGYGSVVLQSGERQDEDFVVNVIGESLRKIGELPNAPSVTLSCGEQSEETYRYWKEQGAKRYLLRIESSNPDIFHQIHPEEQSFTNRLTALQRLRNVDYQVGTGVMIGLPGQTIEDLAGDIDFFREMNVDMIGMGPYLSQADTPMGKAYPNTPESIKKRLNLSLRMIAVTRLVLRDVNIASTTALQAIDPLHGRERGLLAGANVLMPNVGDISHRGDYQLYDNKPDIDENGAELREKLTQSLLAIGEIPNFGVSGDPPHYYRHHR